MGIWILFFERSFREVSENEENLSCDPVLHPINRVIPESFFSEEREETETVQIINLIGT